MRKLLSTLLVFTAVSGHASESNGFKLFDNVFNLGYGMNNGTYQNGGGANVLEQDQFMSMDFEHLFDMGLWVDINAYMNTNVNTLGNTATGTGQSNNEMPSTQNPFIGGTNAKVGYAFDMSRDRLQLTPYALLGRNTNLAMSTILGNNYSNISTDYFYSAGIGGRLEYRIGKIVDFYFDQNMVYNMDQSSPIGGIDPQNLMSYTSTLGAKFSVVQGLQLGLNGFYTNYQAMAKIPTTAVINGGTGQNGNYSPYTIQNSVGGMVTIGYAY